MYCPACHMGMVVDVYRGVPIHRRCVFPARKPPILLPDIFHAYRSKVQTIVVEVENL